MWKILAFGAVLALALITAREARELHLQTSAVAKTPDPLRLYLQGNPHGLAPDTPVE